MIPASYLFKDVFQQSFYDPDIAHAVARHRHRKPGRLIFAWLRHRRRDATEDIAPQCPTQALATV